MDKMDPDYIQKRDALKKIEFLFQLHQYTGGLPYHQDGDLSL